MIARFSENQRNTRGDEPRLQMSDLSAIFSISTLGMNLLYTKS